MSDTLVIRLPNAADAPCEWVSVSTADATVGSPQHGSLTDFAATVGDNRVLVLAPAALVLRLRVAIPLKGAARIRQALPYALEEQIATDVEDEHFAFSKKDAEGLVPVAVVKQELIESWVAELRAAGVIPVAIYSSSDALPAAPATITVLVDGEHVVITDAQGDVTIIDEMSMQALLEMTLDEQVKQLENDATVVPVSLLVFCNQEIHDKYATFWDRVRLKVENLDIKLLPDGPLPMLAGNIVADNGVNLLQGDFARKSELPIQWQQWRFAAVLLAGLLILNFAVKGAQLWQLSEADSQLNAAAGQILAQTFPGTPETADPWSTLRSRLGAQGTDDVVGGAAEFTAVLEALSAGFAKTPGIKMETLSFRSGELDLQLIAPDVSALDKLRQLIVETGQFNAEIQSANPAGDVIKGRMRVSSGGPG